MSIRRRLRRPWAAVVVGVVGGAVVLLWTRGPARAEDAPGDAAGPAPRTHLEAGVLPRAEVVVVGRVRVLVPSRGMGSMAVLRVEAEQVLRGKADPSFTLFVRGGRNTADPGRPSEAWFAGAAGGRYALFLRPSPQGSGFGLEAAFSVDDAEGKEKAEVLARELEVAAIEDPAERGARLVALLLDLLATPKPWSRLHAARELEGVAAQQPGLLTPAVRAELEAVARKTFDEVLRARLVRVLRSTAGGGDPAGEEGTGPAAPRRRPLSAEYLRAVRRLPEVLDPEARLAAVTELARLGGEGAGPDLLRVATTDLVPAVRERAAVLLGDVGARDAATPLRERYAEEPDGAVREAIVRAVGLLGDDGDVAWLEARLETPTLVRPVAFALARVRTPAALAALERIGATARAATPPDEALPRLVEYLLTTAFADAERVAGRAVGPRARRTPAVLAPTDPEARPEDPACPPPVPPPPPPPAPLPEAPPTR
ncbi:MAG: HEAT repeat domain-containing protein [Planctomycetia bacterium]|nr:HEAT repeat domain-containing protein [Planctomycetia bacterium]